MNIGSLQSIMLAIAEARSTDLVFQQMVAGIAEAAEVVLVRLWLVQKDEECPLCAATVNAGGGLKSLHLLASAGRSRVEGKDYSNIAGAAHRIELGVRKIGRIAETGEPLLISHVQPDQPWVVNPDWIRDEGIESFAGQPLIFRGEVLGVLAVFSRAKFSEEEFRWLRTFADHAAVAIANARAFEELDRLKARLERENEYLHEEVKGEWQFGAMVGESRALKKVQEQVALVAETDATALILGESGTGKELVARAIHEGSARRNRTFVKVNCGAMPDELFESEFFGHVKGAFTGAVKDRVGRFELADGGDIFLDEIGEIPLALQPKLLRVLQEKQFERVGDTRTRTVDVRVIAATNLDLRREVEQGRFREDLYYRLTVFPIEVPPLRNRKDDIGPLALHFLRKSADKMKLTMPRLTREQVRELENYDWPGNVRELENVIERATILSKGSGHLQFELATPLRGKIKNVVLEPELVVATKVSQTEILTRQEFNQREKENILAALERTNGKVFGSGGAAELLGMRPTTLASRMKALGLRKQFVAQ